MNRLFVFLCLLPACAIALADAQRFDIPAQPLPEALKAFADQSKMQLLYKAAAVRVGTSNTVVGDFDNHAALELLLKGTGFEVVFSKGNAATVRPVQSASKTTAALAAEARDQPTQSSQPSPSAGEGAQRANEGQEGENTLGADAENNSIQEIIVTAQKREERLLDVPQSVTVLSAGDLSKIGALQLRDFANTIPGMSFTTAGAGFNQLSLRGVTASSIDVSATVGIYVDDVPYGSSSAFAQGARFTLDMVPFDLERIEVLKGPQGTLYGASSMGGLLKYVTTRPDTTQLRSAVKVGVASTSKGGISYDGAASVNAPLIDEKLALRASAFYSRDGGYVDNIALGGVDNVNSADIYGARADLLFTPTDALSMRLTAFQQNIDRDGEGTTDFSFAGAPLYGDLRQNRLFVEPFEQRFTSVSGTLTYDFGPASLISVSSYQAARTELLREVSPVYVALLNSFGPPYDVYSAVGLPENTSTDKFVQEVRLTGKAGGIFEWLIGGFYNHESSGRSAEFSLLDLSGQPVANNLFTVSYPSRYEEYAAFGNLTWHLTEKFDVSGGIRSAQNQQVFTQNGSGDFIGSFPTARSKEDVVTYLANARFHFSDRQTFYVRYATGYRPGGPNFVLNDPITGLPQGPDSFDADSLKSYELGFKGETEDRRFGINAAAFYIDWSNMQVSDLLSPYGAFINAHGAQVRGLELNLTTRPTSNFTVSGAIAYQDSEMSEAEANLGAAKDERLPNVPRLSGSLNADYMLTTEKLSPTVGFTLRYVDDRWSGFGSSSTNYHIPEYTTVDLRASISLRSVGLQLYVRNLFDDRGQFSAFTWQGIPRPAMLQPRTIGISATTRF